jgi:hypothetical protein
MKRKAKKDIASLSKSNNLDTFEALVSKIETYLIEHKVHDGVFKMLGSSGPGAQALEAARLGAIDNYLAQISLLKATHGPTLARKFVDEVVEQSDAIAAEVTDEFKAVLKTADAYAEAVSVLTETYLAFDKNVTRLPGIRLAYNVEPQTVLKADIPGFTSKDIQAALTENAGARYKGVARALMGRFLVMKVLGEATKTIVAKVAAFDPNLVRA